MSDLQDLEAMCIAHGLEFHHKGNGHVQIKGHGTVVNYYPLSKKQTIFCEGKSIPHCTHYDAIKLCKKNGVVGLKPKKKHISENAPDMKYGVQHSESVIKHPYEGIKAPWDYPSRILCYPDLYRIEARRLMQLADDMENPEMYKDGVE